MEASYCLQALPREERPRERLLNNGIDAVSTIELIAIVLSKGIKGKNVLDLAKDLLNQFGSLQNLAEATISELCSIRGMGTVKAIQLKAALNLGLRASRKETAAKLQVLESVKAYQYLKDKLENEKDEHFAVLLLDTKGYVITWEVVSIGTINETLVHPREVFYPAIRHKAAAIILAHNHPSGDPTPSKHDVKVTQNLINNGKLMGIHVYDHLIIGHSRYISLRDCGMEFS